MQAGDVVLFFDGTIRPPKHKRFICVVAVEGWFFRINTKSHFRPHCLILVSDSPSCINHDSFVELRGIVEYDVAELASAISDADAKTLGRLSEKAIRNLIVAVQNAPTLTATEISSVVDALRASYGITA